MSRPRLLLVPPLNVKLVKKKKKKNGPTLNCEKYKFCHMIYELNEQIACTGLIFFGRKFI